MNEPVSIIILNYNGKVFLNDCLNSVLAQSYENFEVIFLDNNSGDGSIEFVNSEFNDKRLKLISSRVNLGFAAGNNEAVKHCSNDLIVLLNNDTVVMADWLGNLVNSMEAGNTIASSFVITKGVPEKYYNTNGSVSYMMYNIMNIFPDKEDEFYPNGCSVIFRKSEINKPFDDDYFFYGEDVYLGLRARFMDMNVRFVKDSIVKHYGSGSSSSDSFRTFCMERNRFLNLYSFFSIWFIMRMMPYILFNHTIKFIYSFFSKKYSASGLIKAYLWFYVNIPTIFRKRKALKGSKKVHEKNVIKYISSRVLNDGSIIASIVNNVSYIYSRLVGIKPVEYYLKKKLPL